MPWKYNTTIIRAGRAWTDDNGIQHPKVWMRWTDAEKAAAGLVWEDAPASEAPFDNRFYWGRQADGTLIPRSLTDVNVVDEDGKAVNDPITGKQMVTLGLKSVAIARAKEEAAALLAPYDWYVIRKSEKSIAIPSTISTYRDAVRTSCAAIEKSINDASDLTAFIALFEGTEEANAPINDWPEEV